MDWSYICWVFAAASSMVVVATPFIPRHHIPVSMQPGESLVTQNTWYIVCCQRHVFFMLSIPSVVSYVSQPAKTKLGSLEGLRKLMRPPMVTYGSIGKG
ncbi:hypothetical protein E2C01_097914 [Portunus trituberculatus]|uniref:Uncharacterized protein n=1 Tax=Portunus trituberculatus TaxID=210409 RepID=A0A5B7K702_PORTR|nr:hypothetical protein [Portunus trituberculatus]